MPKRLANLAALYQKAATLYDVAFDRNHFNSMAQALEQKIAEREGRPIDWNNWNSFIATLSDEEERDLSLLTTFVEHQLEFYQHKLVRFQVITQQAGQDPAWKFLPLSLAGQVLDSGWVHAQIGEWALEKDLSLRPITEAERQAIYERADAYSDSK